MNWGYGEVSITSLAYYYMANQGVPFQDVKDAGYCGIYADNTITFPAGALLISPCEVHADCAEALPIMAAERVNAVKIFFIENVFISC